jgi:hypothetical protein
MRKILPVLTGACFLIAVNGAHAVPSFARQTGLSCNVCHSNPPELTAFGRAFKLHGYLLAKTSKNEKVGNTKALLLSMKIPISVMMLLSNTAYQATQPASQNNSAEFPQQLSIFLASAFARHFGGLAQVTYTHAQNHFGMDNTDLRYANEGKLLHKTFDYGITINTVAKNHFEADDLGDIQNISDNTKTVDYDEDVVWTGVPDPLQNIGHNPGNQLSTRRTATFTLQNGAWKLESIN